MSESVSKATMAKAQSLINQLYGFPQYRQYVTEHKLGLIDESLSEFDEMLNSGALKTPGRAA